MRRPIALAVLSLAALAAAIPAAEAQDRRRAGDGLSITVRPRSFLDAGNVVPAGSLSSPASAFGQTRSYVLFAALRATCRAATARTSCPTRSPTAPSSAPATRSARSTSCAPDALR